MPDAPNHFQTFGAAGRGQNGAYIYVPPRSGGDDITRCVNIVDSLGFPQICMDNQKQLVDKTMLRQCKTLNNIKLVVVLTFIVSRGTNFTVFYFGRTRSSITVHESISGLVLVFQCLLKRFIRKAVR